MRSGFQRRATSASSTGAGCPRAAVVASVNHAPAQGLGAAGQRHQRRVPSLDCASRPHVRPCAVYTPGAALGGGSPSSSSAVSLDAPNPLEDIDYVLFSEQVIKQRVEELGKQLAASYRSKSPLVLGVLTGAFQFTGDLVRAMQPPPRGIQVNFVRASSYGSGTTSSGEVKLKVDIAPEVVEGRHVLLVEDIVDTGLTLTRLRRYIQEECKAASCCIVTLLDKKERRKVPLVPDYTGFECPNEFVVGYGLDMDEEHRTLPFIGVLKPSCYAHKS